MSDELQHLNPNSQRAQHRIVLHVSTRRDGQVLFELRDETIGRSLLMANCSTEMAEYAVRGELLLVMETPETRNARSTPAPKGNLC